MVDTHQLRAGFYVGRALLPSRIRDLAVPVANITAEPYRRYICLGEVHVVDIVDEGESNTAARAATVTAATAVGSGADRATRTAITKSTADVVQPLLDKLPDDLPVDQRAQVEQLLHSYQDLLSTGPYDMGRTDLVEHAIDTGNSRPIRQGLRRHPIAHLDEIDRQVELTRHDLVEPAASPWASNVLLVRKKYGSFRLCVDYRTLNSVTSH